MVCSTQTCAATECAFGNLVNYNNIMEKVAQSTQDCTEPPLQCTLALERFAKAGTHGTCGANEQTRIWAAQVCLVTQEPFDCTISETGNPHILIALMAVILIFLTVRALKHPTKRIA